MQSSHTNRLGRNDSLSTSSRLLLVALAFAGTIFYAMSFGAAGSSEKIHLIATNVGIAAGASWIIFGVVLLLVTGCRPSIMTWVDACLVAMSAGMCVLAVGILLNLTTYLTSSQTLITAQAFASAHALLLVIADALMAVIFVWRARVLGMIRARSILLWTVALNAPFAAILIIQLCLGGFIG